MSNLKISIILPNYNSEKHIAKAIDSFLSQDYPNKELIIVDGKSTDSSHDIIRTYAATHLEIQWITEKDFNVTDAINIGLKYCKGDFIAFLASDVYYYANDLFSCIAYNYKQFPFDGIYFDYYGFYTKERLIRLHKSPNVPFTKNNLLTYGTIAGFDNIFISKEIYKKYQFNPEYNLVSDWEFFLRITQDNNLMLQYVEKIATVNVQDGNNLSLRYQTEQYNQIRDVGNLYNTDKVQLYFENPTLKMKIKLYVKKVINKFISR